VSNFQADNIGATRLEREEKVMTERDTELVGNFEINKDGMVTRREVLLMGALAAGTVAAASSGVEARTVSALQTASPAEPYALRDFTELAGKKMEGLSQNQIEQHLKLYKGYVGKANEIHNKLKDVDITTANATYSPLRELLMEYSYAVNGVVYHEFYFGNLGGKGGEPTGELKSAIEERWGSYAKFCDYLKAAGKSMRGWVVLGYNTRGAHLDFFGLDLHNMWSPASTIPVLVLDVYEHAYMIDYGIDRAKYLDAFVKNLDWEAVASRLAATRNHLTGLDATT
jgi:superoxide dismutase, Fe-Mn family